MNRLGRRKLPGFKTPIKKSFKKIDDAQSVWYWNPGRIGVKFAPREFDEKLAPFREDGDIQITWTPIRERWLVWVRDYKVNRPICQGWRLLFVVEDNNEYVPLDERTLAVLWDRSGRKHGNMMAYWMQIEERMQRDRDKVSLARHDDVGDTARDYYEYTQIKNIGLGSKFTRYHQGD